MVPRFRESIVEDLEQLQAAGILASKQQNHFERAGQSNVFVYVHLEYREGSKTEFKWFALLLKQY